MIRARTVAKVILVAAAVIGALYVLYRLRTILVLIFISLFLAIALGPAVDFVQRRRVPRGLAILVVYLGLLFAVFGIGLLVVPPIVSGVNKFVGDVPGYVDDLRKSKTFRKYDDKYDISDKLREQAKKLPTKLGDAASGLASVTVGVFGKIAQLVTVLAMTFFLLRDGRRLFDFSVRQLGPGRERRARAIGGDIYKAVGGYVVGNLAISLIASTSAYVVMRILGVPFAVPLAVLMAFLDLIPLVGATIGGIIIGIAAAIHDFPTALIIWAIFFIVYQQVENNVLQPVVYRRTVALHPLLVLVAVLIGGTLLGVLGALLAIPVAAAVQIVARDLWRYRPQPTGRPPPEPLPEGGGAAL